MCAEKKFVGSNKPLVSIILPVYNVENYLKRCIVSIIEQSFTDFEIIAVDDGSTDRFGQICDYWASKDDRIKVIHKSNGGLSDARNCGIDIACGKYFTFIDSDDYISKNYLENLLALFDYDPECKMVGSGHYIVQSNKTRIDYKADKKISFFTRREAFESVLYHGKVNVSAWGKMYHRSLFDEIRYPKGHLYEDTYIFGNLLLRTPSYIFSSEPTYFYCKRDSSIVSGGYSSKRLEYIDSVEKLTACALQCDTTLENACIRRRVHANLSVLRYMKDVSGKDLGLRDTLRKETLRLSAQMYKDPNIPRRDKIAVFLLRFGYILYINCWNIYEKIR